MSEFITIPVPTTDREITAIKEDGEVLVSLRHACEAMGVQTQRQKQRLEQHEWATVYQRYTVAEDGKQREMDFIDRRTFTMWLATINPARVKPEVAPIIVAFQKEAADALDQYFFEGAAINVEATEEQLEAAQARIDLLHDLHEPVFTREEAGSEVMTIDTWERRVGRYYSKDERKIIRKAAWRVGHASGHKHSQIIVGKAKVGAWPEEVWTAARRSVAGQVRFEASFRKV